MENIIVYILYLFIFTCCLFNQSIFTHLKYIKRKFKLTKNTITVLNNFDLLLKSLHYNNDIKIIFENKKNIIIMEIYDWSESMSTVVIRGKEKYFDSLNWSIIKTKKSNDVFYNKKTDDFKNKYLTDDFLYYLINKIINHFEISDINQAINKHLVETL